MSAKLFGEAAPSDHAAKLALHRRSKNPWAYYSIFGEPDDGQPAIVVPTTAMVAPSRSRGALSKKGFQDGCRRIFAQYIPPAEGRQLRPHYRDFIIRNERRSPEDRFLLLDTLSKYDISTSGNFQPHFNRERELLTAAKLKQIETTALKNSASK